MPVKLSASRRVRTQNENIVKVTHKVNSPTGSKRCLMLNEKREERTRDVTIKVRRSQKYKCEDHNGYCYKYIKNVRNFKVKKRNRIKCDDKSHFPEYKLTEILLEPSGMRTREISSVVLRYTAVE